VHEWTPARPVNHKRYSRNVVRAIGQAGTGSRTHRTTFAEAAITYMESGGERRFLTPLLKHFAETPIADIVQSHIDTAAAELYPCWLRHVSARRSFRAALFFCHAAVNERRTCDSRLLTLMSVDLSAE